VAATARIRCLTALAQRTCRRPRREAQPAQAPPGLTNAVRRQRRQQQRLPRRRRAIWRRRCKLPACNALRRQRQWGPARSAGHGHQRRRSAGSSSSGGLTTVRQQCWLLVVVVLLPLRHTGPGLAGALQGFRGHAAGRFSRAQPPASGISTVVTAYARPSHWQP